MSREWARIGREEPSSKIYMRKKYQLLWKAMDQRVGVQRDGSRMTYEMCYTEDAYAICERVSGIEIYQFLKLVTPTIEIGLHCEALNQ